MQNSIRLNIIFVLIILLFTLCVIRIFLLRFESGDIYPPYSSLRSDPLGCKALYEAYESIDAVEVERNYLPLTKLVPDTRATLFFQGAAPVTGDFIPDTIFDRLNSFISEGGRIVITFSPVPGGDLPYAPDKEKKGSDSAEKKDSEKDRNIKKETIESVETDSQKMVSLSAKWRFGINYRISSADIIPLAVTEKKDLESGLEWHSSMSFNDLSSDWETIYTINNSPVVIKKSLGKGSLVLCSDAFYTSNEALRSNRKPAFLSWLTGNSERIIFDESHLGIKKNPGIATLIRKYNLHGVAAFLIVFSFLFLWKNTTRFIPPSEEKELFSDHHISSRDSSSGLTSLLRKNIDKKRLIDVCLSEWQASYISENEASKKYIRKLSKIKSIVNPDEKDSSQRNDPVSDYISICRIVSERERP